MDEDYEYFLSKMAPAENRRFVPPSTIERYRGKLPDRLLQYWDEYGWCSYAGGLFWTVDPQEYEPVLEAWIGNTPYMEEDAYHVIARGAFGDILLFGEKLGSRLAIVAVDSVVRQSSFVPKDMDLAVGAFFGGRRPGAYDMNIGNASLFAQAKQKLGPLNHDEMYGFVPALALGGAATLKHVQKLKAVEHLVFLAQLAPLKVMRT